jgi:hypothetical protein
MTPQVVRNRYSKVLSAGGMHIVPTRETCIHNFVGCSARLQKRQASAIYLDHTKTHVLCRRNSSAYGYLSRPNHPCATLQPLLSGRRLQSEPLTNGMDASVGTRQPSRHTSVSLVGRRTPSVRAGTILSVHKSISLWGRLVD